MEESLNLELPDISQATPLTDADKPLVRELAAVLEKHNALRRFGLTLLHQHFAVREDEVLTEEVDEKTRTLITRPVNKESLKDIPHKETSWRLDTGELIAACNVCIWDDNIGQHRKRCG